MRVVCDTKVQMGGPACETGPTPHIRKAEYMTNPTMNRSTQKRTKRTSGRLNQDKNFDQLLSDPATLDEACSLIREVIVLKARTDELVAREEGPSVKHRNADALIGETLALRVRADALMARERALLLKMNGNGLRKGCSSAIMAEQNGQRAVGARSHR